MSLYPNGRREDESETDFCRRMGWGPGTKLTADDGTVIELVFVGHNKILAYWNGEKREVNTTIGCRDWMEVSVSRTEFRIVHKTPRALEAPRARTTRPRRKGEEMTTNQDRAAEVIDNYLSQDPEVHYELFGDEHVGSAQALADAGLLMPDLPEPKTYGGGAIEWTTIDGYVNVEKDLITIFHDERSEGDTPKQLELLCADPGEIIITSPEAAEQMGYLLIAAANHAERNQK